LWFGWIISVVCPHDRIDLDVLRDEEMLYVGTDDVAQQVRCQISPFA
jgi:hypothetical protein